METVTEWLETLLTGWRNTAFKELQKKLVEFPKLT